MLLSLNVVELSNEVLNIVSNIKNNAISLITIWITDNFPCNLENTSRLFSLEKCNQS